MRPVTGVGAERGGHDDLDPRTLRRGWLWEYQGDGDDGREDSETQRRILKRAG